MKIATCNVNGIRARQAQLREWMERDRPDVVCIQELKAEAAQIPEQVKLEDYHAYWHGFRAYSGVSLHIRKGLFDTEPAFSHPEFDMESRIVQAELGRLVLASVYVPKGGKDYEAKLGFMIKLAAWAKELHRDGRELVLCGDMNITRTDLDVHPNERKPGIIGQREEERELLDRLLAHHLVGAVAQPAPAQHRLAPRLHPRLADDRRARGELRRACRLRNQRPCAGGDDNGVGRSIQAVRTCRSTTAATIAVASTTAALIAAVSCSPRVNASRPYTAVARLP